MSEYCELASIWLAPKLYMLDAYGYEINAEPFATAFIGKIAPRFQETFSELKRIGQFSNGETIFLR